MKPACVRCRRFYRVKKNGYRFVEGMPIVGRPEPGLIEPESWGPYKLWACDLWECPDCGHQLLSGYARAPIAEHYEPDFAEKAAGVDVQINDC